MSQAHKRHLDRFTGFWVHHCKGSQCFSLGADNSQNCPFPGAPIYYMFPWAPESAPKLHLGLFSRFCNAHCSRTWQTDRSTMALCVNYWPLLLWIEYVACRHCCRQKSSAGVNLGGIPEHTVVSVVLTNARLNTAHHLTCNWDMPRHHLRM